jgi:hypothetical protein
MNITFCIDTSQDGSCADEDSNNVVHLTKTVVAGLPDEIFLAFTGTGDTPGDPQSDCQTGDRFAEGTPGQTEGLTACTYDSFGNPSSTDQTDGGFLDWIITPNTTEPGTEFASPPPRETDAGGIGQATLHDVRVGSDEICVTLRPDSSQRQNPQSCVQKNVTSNGTTGGGPTVNHHARKVTISGFDHVRLHHGKRHALVVNGQVTSNFGGCFDQVPVDIQIRLGGRWLTRKEGSTKPNGHYSILVRDVQAKYRALAPKVASTDTSTNVKDVCDKAKSRGKRHHH